MYRKLGEAREEIEDREYGAATLGVEDLVDAWDRDLGHVGDLVKLLVVDRYSDAAGVFGTQTRGLDHGEMECYMRPAAT